MNSFALQPFRCSHLRRDDPLGVTRSAPVNAIRIFGRRNERWNRVHVRGKYDLRIRLLGQGCEYIEAIALDRDLSRLISNSAELAKEIIADRGFITAD